MKKPFFFPYIPPLLLVSLSLLSGIFPVRFTMGIEYILAGFFGLAAFVLYGPLWGFSAVLLGTLPTLSYWGHPYGAILFCLENIAVSLLFRYRRVALPTASVLFWLLLGTPIILISYKYFLHISDSSARFILLKMSMNGLGNSVAAAMLIPTIARLHGWFVRRFACANPYPAPYLGSTSMAAYLSRMIITILLFLAVAQTGYHSRHMVAHDEKAAAEKLEYAADQLELYINSPRNYPVYEAFQFAKTGLPDLRFRLIDTEMAPGMAVEDRYSQLPAYLKGETDPAEIKPLTKRVMIWSPPVRDAGTRIEQRLQSVYFFTMQWEGSPRYRIVVELPARSFWNSIYNELSKDLAAAFILLALAALLITPICRKLTRPLADLAELSSRLSTSMGSDFQPQWPDSPLSEIRTLTSAFRLMSKDLNRQFAVILEATQEAMLLCDRNGNILFANSRLGYFFGEPCSGARTLDELFAYMNRLNRDGAGALQEDVMSFLQKSGRNVTFQRNFTYTDAIQKHYYSLYGTSIEGMEGFPQGNRLLVFRDRSEEEEREALKEEMISQISHELRTPLTSILGFSEIMRNKDLPAARHKNYTNTIYNEAVRLSRLVDDFLDLQRMESGNQTYYLVPHDIRELAAQVAEQWKLENMRRLHLTLPETPVFALVDADRIRQVLHNLVSNAFKYSPDGANVHITVGLEGGVISIDVADQGLGIPEGDKDKIFRKFYRVEHNDRRKIPGSGLGLPIAKEIVEAHQGQITFVSRHYGGSVFTVWLPRYTPPATEGKFLLIEKNDHYAEFLAAALEEQGESVLRLGSFEEALFAIGNNGAGMPRMIAADLVGRGLMNGFEFAARLIGLEYPKLSPLIFLEVLGRPAPRHDRQDLWQSGKPLASEQLLQVIEAAAGRARLDGFSAAGRGAKDGFAGETLSADHPKSGNLPPLFPDAKPFHCYFPMQDTGILTGQLNKFGLAPYSLEAEGEVLAAVFPRPRGRLRLMTN